MITWCQQRQRQKVSLLGQFVDHHGQASMTSIRCGNSNLKTLRISSSWVHMRGEEAGAVSPIRICALICVTRMDVVAYVLSK
jgi:hypothetical protein